MLIAFTSYFGIVITVSQMQQHGLNTWLRYLKAEKVKELTQRNEEWPEVYGNRVKLRNTL